MDSVRDQMYRIVPGLGKAPEISSAKKEGVTEQREGKEANTFEGGSAVIAKRKFDAKGKELPQESLVSEDAVIANEALGLYAVSDGVGSGGHGDLASKIVTEAMQEVVTAGLREGMSSAEREALMRSGLQEAGRRLKEQKAVGPEFKGMNATFSGFLLGQTAEGKSEATIAHVSDSRVYRYNKERGLIALTNDDNVLDVLTRYGVIPEDAARAIDQSEREGKNIALPFTDEAGFLAVIQKALPRAVGKGKESDLARLKDLQASFLEKQKKAKGYLQPKKSISQTAVSEQLYKMRNQIFDAVAPDGDATKHRLQVKTVDVKDGDLLFAVSDGVSDPLTEKAIQKIIEDGLEAGQTPQEIFVGIAQAAKQDRSLRQKGKKVHNQYGPDNQTIVRSDVLFEGDDTSVSGVRAVLREDVRVAEPLVEAPDWVEDPGLIEGWEKTLQEARLPDRYMEAVDQVGQNLSRSRSALLNLGARQRRDMQAVRGKDFVTDGEFIEAWKAELAPAVSEAKTRLREVYRAKWEGERLDALDNDTADEFEKIAKSLAK